MDLPKKDFFCICQLTSDSPLKNLFSTLYDSQERFCNLQKFCFLHAFMVVIMNKCDKVMNYSHLFKRKIMGNRQCG